MEVLKVTGISKKYAREYALKDVSLTVNKGDIYGFIGRNGAGKTTLVRIILGLAKETEGSFRLFESDNLLEGRDKIGAIIENPGLFASMTGKDNIIAQCKFLGLNKTEKEVEDLLTLVGLEPKSEKKAKNYSLGMKQRLAIAIALVGSPEFLVLDEPTNGLDPEGIREVRDLIIKLNKEQGITVLVSSHILTALSLFATKYAIIDKGRIITEITAEEMKEKTANDFEIVVKKEDEEKATAVFNSLDVKYIYNIETRNFLIQNVAKNQEEMDKIILELSRNSIIPKSYNIVSKNLEDFFLDVIGGNK